MLKLIMRAIGHAAIKNKERRTEIMTEKYSSKDKW